MDVTLGSEAAHSTAEAASSEVRRIAELPWPIAAGELIYQSSRERNWPCKEKGRQSGGLVGFSDFQFSPLFTAVPVRASRDMRGHTSSFWFHINE
jgi:hypothetical protein